VRRRSNLVCDSVLSPALFSGDSYRSGCRLGRIIAVFRLHVPMRTLNQLSDANLAADTVMTIGSFDGVHRGHQHLLTQLKAQARSTGRQSLVLTFYPHPRAVLRPEAVTTYLSTPQEKAALLEELGLDVLVVLPFTQELANTSAHEFVAGLCSHLRMRELWVGPDFALGSHRRGNIAHLQVLSRQLGFGLHIVTPLCEDGQAISSTRIRALLAQGRVEQVAVMLGRRYEVTAHVVRGVQRGRALGFRTANLQLDPDRALPGDGVYAVWALVEGQRYQAVANIGVRPSFGPGARTLEVHLMDYEGDLYDKVVAVEFAHWLRPEMRFADGERLSQQIAQDVATARSLLSAIAAPH
jgi:riboflavin kinase/FMN adenylyltransferase